MFNLSFFDSTIPIIVGSHCISIAIITLLRIRSVKNKWEIILFFILCLSAAAWSIAPFINHFIDEYGWITGTLITNIAFFYLLLITYQRLIKYIAPVLLIVTGYIGTLLIKGDAALPNFPLKFAYCIFPVLIIMNFIVYHYYYRHKTKFHLSLGITASFMIIGGFYDTFERITLWPSVPAATIGCFIFILVAAYHLLARGYLKQQGWRDYAIELELKEKLLKEKFILLKKANISTVLVLSQTIEAKDPYTRGHCLRVRNFAKAIGKHLRFDKERLFLLELAALLHDIGKIGVSGNILNKKSRLTAKEYADIKMHSDIGADILSKVKFFRPIIPLIRHHHEFYNGNGYPSGLREDQIPLESRILAIADTFDAMISDRPYRRAFSTDKALSVIKEVAGTQLDPQIVKIFISKKIYQIKHDPNEKLYFEF